ncbi:glycosyltransferase 87 family protein [Mycobacterium sp. 1274756.6]|uniref:glycosyltransferase 87 family protein n=1 Tax=Mycobacterium sp. 1274756.6 TaxID=1834076 RepID=UPI0007FC4D36|nr:glycosyltransferase 87 family protein [Mycobacterium sp. 1274756.6]OBJ67724.1 hypothetical protein A5643_16805 [Mycobacterium sp. 1274756.6]
MRGAGLTRAALGPAAIAAVCLALTALTVRCWLVGPYDLEVYRAAGDAVWHRLGLYGDAFPHNLPFTYPPFAAWLFVPLLALPWPVVVAGWTLATLALLAWVITVSFAAVLPAGGWARPAAIGGLLVAAAVSSPLTDHLGFGQINVLLMAMCLADLLGARPRWLPAGVLIGLAAAIKLVPVLFVVYLLVTGRARAAATALGTALAATAAAAAVSFTDSRRYFTELLWHLGERVGLANNATIGNQSLQGALLRLLPADAVGPVWLAGAALLAGVGMWAARRAWRGHGEVAGAAVTGLVAPVITPVSWPHHLVWLVPALGVLAGWSRGARRRWLPPAAAAAVWLLLVVRAHRLGQLLVDAHPGGALRVGGEALRDSFVLACVALVAVLGAGGPATPVEPERG